MIRPFSGSPSRNCRISDAEIGLPGEIIGAGESGVEGEFGARGAPAELRAQGVENQRLRGAEPPGQRLVAAALANPGAGCGLFHRRQERVAHLRKQLRVLVTVDKIRRAAEQFAEGSRAAPSIRRG